MFTSCLSSCTSSYLISKFSVFLTLRVLTVFFYQFKVGCRKLWVVALLDSASSFFIIFMFTELKILISTWANDAVNIFTKCHMDAFLVTLVLLYYTQYALLYWEYPTQTPLSLLASNFPRLSFLFMWMQHMLSNALK